MSSVESSTSPTSSTPGITSTTSSSTTNTTNNNNNTNGVYNFYGNNQNIKIQHYFNYSTIMRDREACSSFLDYLTNVTHCDENLLFLLHLDNIKFMKTVPIMMEQTQVVIDTYVKLESSKELNITDKIRSSVIQQYEELKSLFPNGDFKSNHDMTQEFIQGKIQQIFNELVVQINLQLKQDSFESYLSSEVFEKFIIKKIRDKMQHQQEKEKHQEKQKKKRASSLFPASPNTFDMDNYSFRDSDAADGYNMYEDADSSSGLGANLMKRFVGGLLKGGAALQQAVNNHTNSSSTYNVSASGSFDDVSSTSSNSLTNSTDNLSCNSAVTTSTTTTTSSTPNNNNCSESDDQHVGNFHIKHHRIKSLSNQQPQENANDTVEIMKNIIQDLYKQLIQKDQEIKKLHDAIKQHTQLMGLGGERKSKPLPTAPMSPQPGSHSHHTNTSTLLSEQLTSPRKVPKPLPSTHSRMSLNAEQSKDIKNMNFNPTNNSSVATPSHEHSKSLHQLYSNPSSNSTGNTSNGRFVTSAAKNLTLSTSSATPQQNSAVKKDVSTPTSTNNKEETSGSPLIRRQTTQTLIVGNKKLDSSDPNTPSSPSKTKKVLDISSSSENLKDDSKLPITQRLQFFEKLNAASSPTNSPPKDSTIKRFSQTVSNK
ncbi:predicted protein [Naegleria gruberi]|uniref:Predicted protein n=1 Tax=Naegleria gruberi TaxID=5762 RepID=D2VAC6_NAEGR|nr:uncharacterized protein NAEGRDRAFT_79201 [Naegleria gruberi]EFC46283.1 predicted protein [Naegleria gruberi]|eukprot:XP_002679027.1 predicted protein [Naegleria gruberi strain NEG-M]